MFEKLHKANAEKLVAILDKNSKTLNDLEMSLMHTLSSGGEVDTSAHNFDIEDITLDLPTNNYELSQNLSKSECIAPPSDRDSTSDFAKITHVLLETLRSTDINATGFSYDSLL